MRCTACGTENDGWAKFCIECGTPGRASCVECGSEIPTRAKFCPECGASLAAADGSRPLARPATPDHLAEKITRAGADLEGERKQVTVLFADVQGSMDLQEELDAEEWHRVMNRFFGILCDGVHRFEGTVDKFTGDGIMALFGAPIAHEDHAQRACFAALHLMDRLGEYAAEVRRSHGLNFAVRMGVNSGEVVVGGVGADLAMEYTAVGHTVGLAARMEALAQADTTYLTEATARIVDGYFHLEDLGEFAVKGVSAPVRSYRLVGIGAMRGRLDASRARGLTTFVGRSAEMEVLDDALASALEGDAQVVAVVGEAGVGKSRLCYEFAQRCRERGISVRTTAALPHAAAIPLGVVLELLRDVFGTNPHEEPQRAREKIAGRLVLQDPAFQSQLPLLFDFLGVADPDRPAPQLDPGVRQQALAQLFKQMTHARSRLEPSVFLFDDLHWIDPASAAFMESFIDSLPGTRSLALANYRPEYRPEWIHRTFVRQIALRPLGPEALEELLAELLGPDPSVADLGPTVLRRTGGNPFFAEEVVRSLAESGALTGERGDYRLATGADLDAIPPSVETLLAARIDRLDEEQKLTVQGAAVIGREFSQPVLERVVGLPVPDIERSLRALTTAELLREEAVYPVAEYTFVHALTHDVAYRSQLAAQRRRSHANVAQALVELHPDGLDERAALVSHHLEEAGDRRSAGTWAARAAAWAGRTDFAEADRQWRRTANLLRDEAHGEALALRARAFLFLLMLASRRGLPADDAEALYAAGRQAAERWGDMQTLAFVHQAYGSCRGLMGTDTEALTDALAATERSLQITERLDEPEAVVLSASAVGFYSALAGRLDIAEERFQSAVTGAGDRVPPDYRPLGYLPRALLHSNWCLCLTESGRLADAERHGMAALRVATELDDPVGQAMAEHALAFAALAAGDGAAAMTRAAAALPFFERTGNLLFANSALVVTGVAHGLTGDLDGALSTLVEAVELLRTTAPFEVSLALTHLSRVLLAAGEARRALDAAEEAVERAEASGVVLYLPGALVANARARTSADSDADAAIATAAAIVDRTERLIHDTALRTSTPHLLEARADIAARSGDGAAARQLLRDASRLFDEQGAHGHRDRVAALLRS